MVEGPSVVRWRLSQVPDEGSVEQRLAGRAKASREEACGWKHRMLSFS